MRILFDSQLKNPKLSLILLDWSCRESFHMLDYLNKQNVPRDQYEIIWIEYYDRQSSEIKGAIEGSQKRGQHPWVDQWIVLDMPSTVYYHKHLMYNTGIALSSGEIVAICDSDAMVRPTFVESILAAFKNDPHIALHMDEVRNGDKRFYPFNFPSIEEVLGEGCLNWSHGTTTGMLEKRDPIHARNYGACMCAVREDLIHIGGADEHIDYLGHICGPYELTFRLVNQGKREVWHEEEFLYHVWHPGSDGLNNYLGPHDGKNVSSTALEAIKAKRVLPLLENPAIQQLRLNKDTLSREALARLLVPEGRLKDWVIEENKFQLSLGRIAYFRKEFAEAISHWSRVTGALAHNHHFLAEYGWAHYFVGNYDIATGFFQEAIKIEPDEQLAWTGLGWTQIQKKKFREAKLTFKRALQIDAPEDSEALNSARRGMSIARTRRSLFARMWNSINYYGVKVVQRVNRGDFTIPKRYQNTLLGRIASGVFRIIQRTGLKLPDSKLLKGEAEFIRFGYVCDIPTFKVEPNLDFLLLEIPPRYVPMMPNGVAYVHNILIKTGVKFQTIDMNIIVFHRFHERRIRERLDPFVTLSGYVMKEDPWDNARMSEWDHPEVIAHFMIDLDALLVQIVQNKPKAVGISLNGNNRNLVKTFVKKLRQLAPQIVIVVGGYDCVYYGLGQFLFPDFDYMVIGEAEPTLEPLVKALARGERPKDLIGIVSRFDSPERVWQKPPLLQDLDSIDFPKYPWVDHACYQDYERKHLIPITASRGCRWARCRFCGECFTFRRRDPFKVVDEIEYHVKKGFHSFHFNESDVNGDPQALFDLCSEIIRRKLQVKFAAQLRIDRRNTAAYFKHLALAGFSHLRFGVDGWTDDLLKKQNKGYTMEMVFQNLRDCHAAGITTTVNMVIGVPGETEDDVEESIRNVIRCKDYISVVESFNTLLLVCGSEYHRDPEKYKIHFRKTKEEIYETHVNYVPSDLWYSEAPYIDQEVRMRRLERIISELYKNGVNIGSFASKVVENLRLERSKSAASETNEACSGKPGVPA